MRTEFLRISVLKVALGPRVKLASCKSALNPRWFILLTVLRRWSRCTSYSLLHCGLFLRGDLFYVLPCVILVLCFSVLLALRLPRLGKRELILVRFVSLFDLRLFGFVCFLVLLVSRKVCGLTVALPGLFSYFFAACNEASHKILDEIHLWADRTVSYFPFSLPQTYNGENVVGIIATSFLIGSSSNLQVMKTSYMSLNFGLLTLNLIGSIKKTCRSKTILIGSTRWPPWSPS